MCIIASQKSFVHVSIDRYDHGSYTHAKIEERHASATQPGSVLDDPATPRYFISERHDRVFVDTSATSPRIKRAYAANNLRYPYARVWQLSLMHKPKQQHMGAPPRQATDPIGTSTI
jgi:hypothetical protein